LPASNLDPHNSWSIFTDATIKKYIKDISTVMSITGCEDLVSCFNKYNNIINFIDNAKQKNGQPYSVNSKKGYYQSIVFVIDQLKLNLPHVILNQFKNKLD